VKRALVVVAFLATPLAAQQFGEVIDVVRYVIPARVVDARGDAITGLDASDFTATIGGKTATVESVEWLGSSSDSADPAAAPQANAGRLIVVFVQTDFARNAVRVTGQMKFNELAKDILDMLESEDHVAVVSQDSQLKLQCDFTRDRKRARDAIRQAIEIRRMELPPAPDSGPSLARHLVAGEMQKTSSAGEALRMIAHALQNNEGSKVVIVGGWGIGEYLNRRVLLDVAWRDAMQRFRTDRTPVITLGTGMRGGVLSYGLATTASQTGGLYAGTQDFAEQTMTRLRGVLTGYYELVLRVDQPLPPGEHRVELKTSRARANVLTAPLTIVRNDEAPAIEIVELPAAEPPVSGSRLYLDAMRKLRDGDADEAEALFTRAIEIGDAPDESLYERGLLRAARGEIDTATKDLQAYLERAPNGQRAVEARDLLRTWR
jgi:tetratricopeptide (TPR) repeat protein